MDHAEWHHLCQCPVCGNTARNPRILPCFHTVCTACLTQHIQQQQGNTSPPENTSAKVTTFQCPECSTDITVPTYNGSGGGEDGDDVIGVGEGEGGGGGGGGGEAGGSGGPSKEDFTTTTIAASRFKTDSFVMKLTEVLNALGPDKICDTCVRMGETNQGTDWCLDCFDVLCCRCAKNHLYGKATSDHNTLHLSQLRSLTLDSIIKRDATHACPKHAPEVIKLYCLDCRTPVCVQCFSESHRQCQSCLPLQASLDKEEDGVAEMMVKLSSLTFDLEDDVLATESGAGILENSVMKAQEAIRKIAADARKKIDESEEELLNRLYSVSSQLQEKVGDFRETPASRSSDLKFLSYASNRMDALLKYGSSLEILDLFSSMKTIMSRVERSQGSVVGDDASINSSATDADDDDVRLKVNFEMSSAVKLFLQDFESLGDIAIEDFKSDEGSSSWGVCVTPQDSIIVVDCRAKKVQKFGISGDLIDHIQISEEPRDVTPCSDDDVAITIMKKQIFVVTVSTTMSLKRRIKTQKQYEAISASSARDMFLVSSLEERCVDVISAQGDLLKSFGAMEDGKSVFETPRYVTYTADGRYIVSDSTKNIVTCVSEEGGLVFSYDPPGPHKMKSAQGVCCDTSGNLFVADFGNSRVHLLTSGGEFQRFVLGRDSGLSRPVAMSLSQGNKLVIVQSDGMVKIFGYESMKHVVKFKGTCWCPRCLANMESKEKESQEGRASTSGKGSGSERSSMSSVTSPTTRTPPRSPMMKTPTGGGFQRNGFGSRNSSTSSNQRYYDSPPLSPAQRRL